MRQLISHLTKMSLLAAALLVPAWLPAARGADEPAAPTTRPARGERPQAGAMLDRLHSIVTGLDLTDEQKPKIETEFAKARKSLEESLSNPPAEGPREAVGKALSELRTGIGAILTEDQKKAMRDKLEQAGIGGARGQGAGGRAAAGPLAAFRENMGKLGLSDEQKSKVEEILKDNQEKVAAIIKDAQGDRQAIGEKIRPVIQEHREKILGLLNDEQKAKLKELTPERGRGEPPTTRKAD